MAERTPGKIQKLEEAVINRIAAGEVIQRPANALKELLENALDAGATSIMVVVKAGGMKLLQIQDDGTGIRKEDLAIVCERFTTSKLRKFEDLQTIGTYGFRGEALASISHVAHLSIVTKTEESQCAYKAEYMDGKLKEFPDGLGQQNPKPCAGKQGTTIIVEELFYNMETRRRALKSATEEHNKVVDVVMRYAVHNAPVGFSLKKFGEKMTEVRTPSKSTVLDNIKILFGAAIARELVPVCCDDPATHFKMKGYVSNVNYSTKKFTSILFINHRLVDSSALRKSVETIYSNYLPKGSHPFMYLSIEIDPRNVDVNVHPTKHEVHFLHEDKIIAAITNSIENTLMGSNESRTFFVQSLLPGATAGNSSTAASVSSSKKRKPGEPSDQNASVISENSSVVQPKNMVRTDPKAQKLDKYLTSTPNPDLSTMKSFNDSQSRLSGFLEESVTTGTKSSLNPDNVDRSSKQDSSMILECSQIGTSQPRKKREIRLRSVKNMREKIKEDCHEDLLNTFKNHTFVGSVDRSLALIQCDVKLFVVSNYRLSAELFYQKMVTDFGDLGAMTIEDPIEIKDLVTVALECDRQKWLMDGESVDDIAKEVHDTLMSKSKMLDDYFSLKFNEKGQLVSIPLLLDNYFPSMEGIPNYLLSIAKKVNWTNEQNCFESFCFQTALFYAVQPGGDAQNNEMTQNGHSWKWTIEHILFPEMKKCLLPPKVFAEDSTVVLLTTLPDLYRVFERC